MKLADKFEKWLGTNPSKSIAAIQCRLIAEDFAIGFVEFVETNSYKQSSFWRMYDKKENVHTIEELLEIYKKEKEL